MSILKQLNENSKHGWNKVILYTEHHKKDGLNCEDTLQSWRYSFQMSISIL